MKRFLTHLAKRTVLGTAALAFTFLLANTCGAQGQAPAQGKPGTELTPPPTTTFSLVGLWYRNVVETDGTKAVLGMKFDNLGRVLLMKAAGSKIVWKIQGTYTFANQTLTLTVKGKQVTMPVVSAAGDTLVTTGSNNARITWTRYVKK
jgi:hypothetical protein